MSIEKILFETDPIAEISKYSPEKECAWCHSKDITFPITGFRVCRRCGKHALYTHRFWYLEGTGIPITRENVLKAGKEANIKYDTNNKIAGTRYYLIDKLLDQL